jgi:hypothetical protein
MMDEHLLDQIAVRVVESWLLLMGFQLAGGWDESDINCRREYGPHVIWTVSAFTPGVVDADFLAAEFSDYLSARNQLASCIKFQFYDIGIYPRVNGGTFVYASICQ